MKYMDVLLSDAFFIFSRIQDDVSDKKIQHEPPFSLLRIYTRITLKKSKESVYCLVMTSCTASCRVSE